jgi:quercetin dioxygenase-like cupin family protein
MGIKPKTINIRLLLSFIFFNILACAPSPHFYLENGGQLTHAHLDEVLAEKPLSTDQNIRVVTLGKGKEMSHHLVQIRDREVPHVHKTHDLTVVMLKGKGYLMLEQKRIDLIRGDILFIPRGLVHYFINTFSEPSVGLAVFSPVFDGKDSIPVGKTPLR